MKKLPSLILITVFIFLILTVPASAVTIDFENVPQSYWYSGGGQNIGNYFSGVTFGPQATILEDQIYGYNSDYYPPNSGHAVMFTDDEQGNAIQADFNVPTNYVSLYYTSATDLYLEAYDSSGNQIASVSDVLGNNILLQVTSSDYNIAYVIMHDGGNFYTVDDFSFNVPSAAVPEPSTLLLLGSGLIGLWGLRKKFKN
jgi:hypothetical protein